MSLEWKVDVEDPVLTWNIRWEDLKSGGAIKILIVQMADTPIFVETLGDTMEIQIMLSSSSVTVAKEEYSFSFSSLIAG